MAINCTSMKVIVIKLISTKKLSLSPNIIHIPPPSVVIRQRFVELPLQYSNVLSSKKTIILTCRVAKEECFTIRTKLCKLYKFFVMFPYISQPRVSYTTNTLPRDVNLIIYVQELFTTTKWYSIECWICVQPQMSVVWCVVWLMIPTSVVWHPVPVCVCKGLS